MRMASSIRWAAGVLAVWLLAGCTQAERTTPPVSEKPPFDVQQVMDQVHFAFRPQGQAWEGGHSTYAVRVEPSGFSVTPYHYPQGRPEGAEPQRALAKRGVQREEAPAQEFVKGEPVRFGAARVRREGMVLASSKSQGRVKNTGGLALARGEVEEHFRNSKDGVEQFWSFEQKPEGTGALEVRLPVENGNFM